MTRPGGPRFAADSLPLHDRSAPVRRVCLRGRPYAFVTWSARPMDFVTSLAVQSGRL